MTAARDELRRVGEAAGWPRVGIPGRPAESVAMGAEAWALFVAHAPEAVVAAVSERMRLGQQVDVKGPTEGELFG